MKNLLLSFLALSVCQITTAQQVDSILLANGITRFDSLKTANGINLLTTDYSSTDFLDMYGNLIHKIPIGLICALPDGNIIGKSGPDLIKFDADLNVIWRTIVEGGFHHDLTFDDQGNIYVISNNIYPLFDKLVRFDAIKIYSSEGAFIREWKLYDHLEEFVKIISKSAWCSSLPLPYDSAKGLEAYMLQDPERFLTPSCDYQSSCFEFSHFNSIQVLKENVISKKIPAFKKGNLLLSFSPYSCYGVLNLETGKIEWTGYLPEKTTLHTPFLTDKGTVLVFQNSTAERFWASEKKNDLWLKNLPNKKSPENPGSKPRDRLWVSISEYDLTNQKVWEYTADSTNPMRADYGGSTQRLTNGNTLVCIADEKAGGRVFEVTPKKEIVWEYVCPDIDPEKGTPWGFYRGVRVSYETAKKMMPGRP